MKYRIETVLDAETATTAATKTQDIDVSDPISKITLQFKGTNNGSTPTAHGAKMISKIELVDGSDILHSVSGIQSQAISFSDTGKMPFQVNEFRDNVMNIQTFELNFGRWLWDTQLALDPTKFRNLQLKITHDKALGGSAPDAATLGMFLHLFDEKKVNPMGFLQNKEWKGYSLVNSAVELTNLPVDLPIRKLFIQSLSGGKQPWEQFNKIKLTEDEGRKTPINELKTSDLLKLKARYHRIEEVFLGIGTGSAVDHFMASTYDWYANISNLDAALTNNFLPQDYGGTQAVSGDSTDAFAVRGSGVAPHGTLDLPTGIQEDINDWFTPNPNGNLKLKITAGSSVGSSSTAEILVQQLRKYGLQR